MKRLKARHKLQQLNKHGIHLNAQVLKACYGKVRYLTYADAKTKAEKIPGNSAYKCRFCKFYHFGHKK